jgi:signal recognition particle subunit SRP72
MQMQLITSNPNNALETFEKYLSPKDDKERYKPGYVGLLVWLYEQSGMHDKAVKTLEDAGNFWKNISSSNESTLILKQTAAFKIKTGRYQEAAQYYEQLVKVDPLDTQAIAGLVSAYSHYNVEKAEQYETALPEIKTGDGVVPMDIDVDSIERIVPGVKKSYYKKTDAKNDRPSQKTHKKKKKRKPLLPKSYDPSVPPDPERWLPKRERSTFKAKGKRKQQLMKGGSQGTAVAGGGIGGTGSANIGKR